MLHLFNVVLVLFCTGKAVTECERKIPVIIKMFSANQIELNYVFFDSNYDELISFTDVKNNSGYLFKVFNKYPNI